MRKRRDRDTSNDLQKWKKNIEKDHSEGGFTLPSDTSRKKKRKRNQEKAPTTSLRREEEGRGEGEKNFSKLTSRIFSAREGGGRKGEGGIKETSHLYRVGRKGNRRKSGK